MGPLEGMNASELEDVAQDVHCLLSWPKVFTPLQTDVEGLAQSCMAVDPSMRPIAHDALAELSVLSSARSSQGGVGDSDKIGTRRSQSLQSFLTTYRSAATQSKSEPSMKKDAPKRD